MALGLQKRLQLQTALGLNVLNGAAGPLPPPPPGLVYLLGADGAYLLGADGAYLLGLA